MPLILQQLSFSHTLAPSQVEFRARTGWGEQIVRVSFTTHSPRVKAWTEKPDPSGRIEIEAMYLSLAEVELSVQEARSLLGV